MNKLIGLIAVCIFMIFSLQAQKLNKKMMDTKSNKEILNGKCNLKGLKEAEFGKIFKKEYKNYLPANEVIALLQPKMMNISFEIILGTWCGDSKEQLPRFIRILDAVKYKTKTIPFLCVDRSFKADGFDREKQNILKIPTFIIYRNNIEIGRIVETPLQTLEKDLLDILVK
ncbi:MAG: thioredoxin family protein [Bacteroidales bacterium]